MHSRRLSFWLGAALAFTLCVLAVLLASHVVWDEVMKGTKW